MKNTYIELDMLFIRADGRVAKIIERAHPLSEALLSSDTPVSAVLELKGGGPGSSVCGSATGSRGRGPLNKRCRIATPTPFT